MATANTTIRLKKSLVSGVIPSSLANGEVALNQADGKLYYSKPDGTISFIQSPSFSTVNVSGSLILASSSSDTLSFAVANGISIIGNPTSKTITLDGQSLVTSINTASFVAQNAYNTANVGYNFVNSGGTISGNINVTGQANVYQRLSVGTGNYTILPNLIAQFTGTSDFYSQINNQNLSGKGTGDVVVTANNGTDLINYTDMGMAGSNYNNQGYNSFPIVNPNDGYFLVIGNPSQNFGGNVIYGTTGSGNGANALGDIVFVQGQNFTETARFKLNQGLVIETGTGSTGTTSGALVVQGGVGVSGGLYAGQVYEGTTRLSTSINQANTFLQANDALTLSAAQAYTNIQLNANVISLLGIDAVQNTRLNVVEANTVYISGVNTTQNTRLGIVEANTVYLFGALNQTNTNIVSANTQLKSYTDGQITVVNNNIVNANTQLKSYTDGAITSANTQLKSYVDGNLSYLQGALNQANSNIISANTQLKSYTDGIVTSANNQLKSYVDGQISYQQSVNNNQNTSINTVNNTLTYLQNIENSQNTLIQSAWNTANVGYNFVGSGGTVSGPVSINGNLQVTGNISYTGNVISQTITGNSAQFIGNTVTGFGALYAGVPGFTPEPQTVIQLSSNYNGYAQLNFENENSGINASTDLVCTADNGTSDDTYIDMGINSSLYNQTGYGLVGPNDGYVYVYGNTSTGGGNLVLSTMTAKDIIFSVNGQDNGNEVFRVSASGKNVKINTGVQSTSNTTGSLVVNGGVGVTGNINATGSVSVYNGLYSTGSYSGSYSDGVIVDYVNGTGRISVGSNDGIVFYNNTEISRVKLLSIQANGELVLTQALQTASQGIIFSDGTVQTTNAASYATTNAISTVANSAASNTVYLQGALTQANTNTVSANTYTKTLSNRTYTFYQNTSPTAANTQDQWINCDTGVMYENFGTPASPVWAEVGPTSLVTNSIPGTVLGSQANITYIPTTTVGSGIQVSAANTQGGTGYADLLKLTNISGGTTNANKFIRLTSIGELQVVNSSYQVTSLSLNDNGDLTLAGNTTVNGIAAGYAPNRPAFCVRGNGGQVTATTTLTNSNWNIEYNQGSYLNGTTGIFTAPVAGLYQVNLIIRTSVNNYNGIIQALVRKTAAIGGATTTLIMVEFGNNTSMNHAGGSNIVKLAVGDTLQLIASAGTISFDGNDNWSVAYIG